MGDCEEALLSFYHKKLTINRSEDDNNHDEDVVICIYHKAYNSCHTNINDLVA